MTKKNILTAIIIIVVLYGFSRCFRSMPNADQQVSKNEMPSSTEDPRSAPIGTRTYDGIELPEGTRIWAPDGYLAHAILSANAEIQGVICRKGDVFFGENPPKLLKCLSGQEQTIHGKTFKPNDIIELAPDGNLLGQ